MAGLVVARRRRARPASGRTPITPKKSAETKPVGIDSGSPDAGQRAR